MNDRARRAGNQGGGFAAAHPPVRRAGYGSAPPGSRLLRIAHATTLRAGPDPGDLCGPSGRKRGQATACPARRAAHKHHHQNGSLHGSRGLPDTGYAPPGAHETVRRHFPRGRWGSPDQPARLVAWLATDEAAWITGQTINAEGGFRRYG